VNPLPDHRPGQQRAAVRTDARLDAATRQKVDDLATRFDRPRAAVLCQIMAWGLSRAQPAHLDQGESPGPVRHLSLYVASDLHEHVEKAAAAAGVKAAPWLRHMVRQITITDFPASWQEATPRERSHDSRTYTTRFMLRLDESSQTKLEQLIRQLGVSKADIIRQLIAQAKPEDFPPSWQMRATERRAQQPRR
jgi:predicted transcriptional regulator